MDWGFVYFLLIVNENKYEQIFLKSLENIVDSWNYDKIVSASVTSEGFKDMLKKDTLYSFWYSLKKLCYEEKILKMKKILKKLFFKW